MKKFIMMSLMAMMFLVTAPPAKSQFTNFCYVKTTAFTSQSKLAASNYPTWESEELMPTPRAAITGDGRYRKPE